ncbi:MAG TPA: site-specific integrase [Paludibacter sp.]
MITIKQYLRCDNKEKKSGYVWISFYVNREKVNFTTKIACEVKHWNEKTRKINIADPDASDKNLIIAKIVSRINDVIVKYRLRNKVLTRVGFMRSYNRPDDFESFYSFCTDYQKKIIGYTELVTINQHTNAINKLKAFKPDLHFDDFDLELLTTFYHKVLRKKLCENTAFKIMTHIRKYVNAAVKAGYMDENPFKDFHIKRTKANYTYLEEEELKTLLALYRSGELEKQYYKTLQFFLYMCFSSQHVGDALPMKLEQFTETTFSYFRMKLRNSKPELVTVPISASLRDLIKTIAGFRKHGTLFENLPAEQTMNRYLKTICERDDVKITKKVTHKTGRHTFATFYLDKTNDLNSLRDILGHSDIRETLIYAHVLERSKQKSIDCFDVFNAPG